MSETEIVAAFNITHKAGPFSLSVHALVATRTHDETDLVEMGAYLLPMGSAFQWWYADWYILLEARTGERASKIAGELGFTPATIERWAAVARMFPPEKRHKTLTYSHHRQVATLPERERTRLLELAKRKGLTVQALGQHVSSAKNQLEMISSGTLPMGDQREVSIDPELDDEDATDAEAAEDRARKYHGESDAEAFAKAKEHAALVRVSYAQIKALMEQMMDYAENDPAGKYLAVHSLKDALHQVQTAVRHGIPYGLCGSCGGTGADGACKYCLGLGWLNKDRWRRQKREMKI